jgi:hypothetical protein
MKQEHKPKLPITKDDFYDDSDHFSHSELYDGNDLLIGKTYCEETAAFIVSACNSHYELLEALKALLENEGCYATNSIGMRFDSDELELAKHKAREAIEKAKEK